MQVGPVLAGQATFHIYFLAKHSSSSSSRKRCLHAGGSSPSWAGCDYPIFTSFLILNGIAFMLSVASVIVVTAFPLILNRTPHQAAWWGGVLLLLSMVAFIAAFVLAGFVTVNYRAPNASCASLHCADGGVQCSTYAVSVNGIGIFTLEPNVGVLNNMGSSNLSPVCVQYNASTATSDTITTLYPGNPECPGTTEYSSASDFRNCTDVLSLLQSAPFQRQVVCMPQSSFPDALPTADSAGLTIPINSSQLAPYTSLTEFYQASDDHRITDLISTPGNQTDLLSYYDLDIVCFSTYSEGAAFNTICDTTLGLNLSVTKTGDYMTEAVAASNGATIFGVDLYSKQVATSIEVLSAFFGLVLVLIIFYMITTKLKH